MISSSKMSLIYKIEENIISLIIVPGFGRDIKAQFKKKY